MDSRKDDSEGAGDPEDLPSDFFDDFNKDEFMQGLSVIDSWDDEDTGKRRIDAEAVESVDDLRELIDNKDGVTKVDRYKNDRGDVKFDKFKWYKGKERTSDSEHRRSGSRSKLDDYIKPGSRRDPSKTNEAIKRDKEVKVKELLAKHLDDDLRPPGTELDDYYGEGVKSTDKKNTPPKGLEPRAVEPHGERPRAVEPHGERQRAVEPHGERPRSVESRGDERPPRPRSREHQRPHKVSPLRHRRSPFRSPRRERRSPPRFIRQYSPHRKFRRFSPPSRRISPNRRSPRRYSPRRRSPRRFSRRSRSPLYRSSYNDRRSQSPKAYQRDTFLYPSEPSGYPPAGPYPNPGGPPGYNYVQPQSYLGGYGPPGYEYGEQPQMPPVPQPVPAPMSAASITPAPVPTPLMSLTPLMNLAPAMVPPPSQMISPTGSSTTFTDGSRPYDALAQLVADGKLSQQDYLKLAPNKGVTTSLDTKSRVVVLNRCQQALSKLVKLLLPNRLTMHHGILSQEPKYLAPKFCSPLKRQAAVEFQFTKTSGATVQQNKQLVDSIIATIGLDKVVSRPKKKIAKEMKDASVQTSKPFCDVCEIREATNSYDASTSIDPEHFSSSIHTQVVEQDLFNSKSIFNPTGSATDTAPISIAHMTPAQLVSQLAARAKTLKQTSDPVPPPNQWRNTPNYDNRGHYGNYDNYSNYRY